MAENFVGKTVGPYRIDCEIGRGGMGVVYRGHQTSLNRSVAIKVLPHSLASDPEMVSRFRQEALTLAGIQHENIVHIHDILEDAGTYFLVMEFLDGVQLSELIERRVLTPDQVLAVGRSIAHALTVVHARGIVHRDIKSHNVMVTRDGRVKLMDFGVARVEGGVKTVAGSVLGTPDYMAPEQIQGGAVSSRTDIYSLGVLLYEMATGRLPFAADDPFALAMKHVTDQPTPPRQVDPTVSKDLEDTILRAMSKDPQDRQESANLLESELVAIGHLIGHDITLGDANPRAVSPPPMPAEQRSDSVSKLDLGTLTQRAKKHWLRIAAAALLLLLFGVGLSMALRSDVTEDHEVPDTERVFGTVSESSSARSPVDAGPPAPRPTSTIDLETVLGGGEESEETQIAAQDRGRKPETPPPTSKPSSRPTPKPASPPQVEPVRPRVPRGQPPVVADVTPTRAPQPRPDYRCREYVEFDVSPEEAWVIVDGTNIGTADDWDGSGGGGEWTPSRGTYTVDLVCRGHESRRIVIQLDPRSDEDECNVDFELERVVSRRERRRLGGC